MIRLEKTVNGYSFQSEHVLSVRQFGGAALKLIFARAITIKGGHDCNLNEKKGVIILFYQPSTRTFSSFSIAVNRLKGNLVFQSQAAQTFSSAAKGESLADTIHYYCASYPETNAIILRHDEDGSAMEAAKIADSYGINIINAGDGTNEHPTQALLDLFTIGEYSGSLDGINGIKLCVCNDVQFSRTIRSLCLLLLANFNVSELGICAPKGISFPRDLMSELICLGLKNVHQFENLYEAAYWSDFLYMTRPQIEYQNNQIPAGFQQFRIDSTLLDSLPAECQCRVMHPMPIDGEHFNEITPEARHHPRSIIFPQAANGVIIRMALLKNLFDDF